MLEICRSRPAWLDVYYRQLGKFTIEFHQKLHCNLDGDPAHKEKSG